MLDLEFPQHPGRREERAGKPLFPNLEPVNLGEGPLLGGPAALPVVGMLFPSLWREAAGSSLPRALLRNERKPECEGPFVQPQNTCTELCGARPREAQGQYRCRERKCLEIAC